MALEREPESHARGRLRRVPTDHLTSAEIARIRAIMDAAFGSDPDERFSDEDWRHALGGLHVILEHDGEIVSHAAVVGRDIVIGERPLRTGYVEAVATAPERQGHGFGTTVMRAVDAHIQAAFELGALGTGAHHFYERLGWRTWRGPSFVRAAEGPRATPADDGYIMVLPTASTPELDPAAPISCEWRSGDVW